MKKYFSTFFALFCFMFIVVCLGVSGVDTAEDAFACPKVLRLHVLANSDSTADQALKIKVRDGIMPLVQELFCDCTNVNEALNVTNENKTLVEDAAKRIIEEAGSSQSVKVVVGKAYYPEKVYSGEIFPEGEYLSVRVILGKGVGHNWWCVLFPQLGSAGVEQAQNLQENNDGGVEIFGCRVKLKILEYFK